MDNLNAKPVNNNTNASICNGLPSNCWGKAAKLIVPVAPYISEIPNNKMPEEKADDRIIFIAASEDILLSRSKFANAATGIVANSSER